jgi:ribosomal protein S18 acetylase RimI-like enzyme
VGLGVLEDHFLGIFDIVVDKAYRNTGVGYHIVDNILRWGKKMGADTAYLQVLNNNIAAIRLYEKMGFRECYQYWYRMKKYPS